MSVSVTKADLVNIIKKSIDIGEKICGEKIIATVYDEDADRASNKFSKNEHEKSHRSKAIYEKSKVTGIEKFIKNYLYVHPIFLLVEKKGMDSLVGNAIFCGSVDDLRVLEVDIRRSAEEKDRYTKGITSSGVDDPVPNFLENCCSKNNEIELLILSSIDEFNVESNNKFVIAGNCLINFKEENVDFKKTNVELNGKDFFNNEHRYKISIIEEKIQKFVQLHEKN